MPEVSHPIRDRWGRRDSRDSLVRGIRLSTVARIMLSIRSTPVVQVVQQVAQQ